MGATAGLEGDRRVLLTEDAKNMVGERHVSRDPIPGVMSRAFCIAGAGLFGGDRRIGVCLAAVVAMSQTSFSPQREKTPKYRRKKNPSETARCNGIFIILILIH